jgi:hypothetical protein
MDKFASASNLPGPIGSDQCHLRLYENISEKDSLGEESMKGPIDRRAPGLLSISKPTLLFELTLCRQNKIHQESLTRRSKNQLDRKYLYRFGRGFILESK